MTDEEMIAWLRKEPRSPRQNEIADTIEALRAENARLREALKPFAEGAEEYCISVPSHYPADEYTFKVGELRAARAAMGETE